MTPSLCKIPNTAQSPLKWVPIPALVENRFHKKQLQVWLVFFLQDPKQIKLQEMQRTWAFKLFFLQLIFPDVKKPTCQNTCLVSENEIKERKVTQWKPMKTSFKFFASPASFPRFEFLFKCWTFIVWQWQNYYLPFEALNYCFATYNWLVERTSS